MKKLDKKLCKSCYGKRYYTQIFGFNGYADFEGDKSFKTSPKIYQIACPTCNFHNKRKIKDVFASWWNITIK